MKKRDLLRKIEREAKSQNAAWELLRNGANHDVYTLNGVRIPIARHSEFSNRAAEMIWKECEEVLGEGWWR